MSRGAEGTTGCHSRVRPYEERRIVLAQGIESHESDFENREQWRQRLVQNLRADKSSWRRDELAREIAGASWDLDTVDDDTVADAFLGYFPNITYHGGFGKLENMIGSDFQRSGNGLEAQYISTAQRVRYELRVVQKRTEYKEALETDDEIVIYGGHSRYGRGAVFHQYSGTAGHHGEQWESGTNADNGIFRLGYWYVPVELHDVEKHQYRCTPFPVEWDIARRSRRHPRLYHPDALRRMSRIEMPENLRRYVHPDYRSESNHYWGFRSRGKVNLLMQAGWDETAADPYDLGATELNCRTFCHFGCSSRKHYWNIVRRAEYKAYERPRPPTDRLAYFTTAPSNSTTIYWLYYLLMYDQPNGVLHLWNSHEYAKHQANRRLRAERLPYTIY